MRRRLLSHGISLVAHLALVVTLLVTRDTRRDDIPIEIEFVEPPPVESQDTPLPAPDVVDEGADFEKSLMPIGALKLDVAKIAFRRANLFPFLTLDLKFLGGLPQQVTEQRERLENPFATPAADAAKPPLEISDAGLQQAIDKSWSRRHRWATFGVISDLLTSHATNSGQAPHVVRRYLDQNILQPFCDAVSADPRIWAMLENAADHADFIDFVRGFAKAHPSSQTTTELLFLLDELAQGSRDVLITLMQVRPDGDLVATRTVAPEAYQLVRELQDHYARWLLARQMDIHGVRAFYDELRLRLLATIIEITPGDYRAADARYLAGEILFNARRFTQAYRTWRGISPNPTDAYYQAYSDVLRALDGGTVNPEQVRRALANEQVRWRLFSIDRLRQFGHRCDTF